MICDFINKISVQMGLYGADIVPLTDFIVPLTNLILISYVKKHRDFVTFTIII